MILGADILDVGKWPGDITCICRNIAVVSLAKVVNDTSMASKTKGMKIGTFLIICAWVICVVNMPAHMCYASSHAGPEIIVGLGRPRGVTIAVSDGYTLLADDGCVQDLPSQANIILKLNDYGIEYDVKVSGSSVCQGDAPSQVFLVNNYGSGSFTVLADSTLGSDLIGREYRGDAIIMKDGRSLILANLLQIEQYLWSVVSCELPKNWHTETLKAQAIASRTYALRQTGFWTPNSPGFDRGLLRSFSLKPGDVKVWAGATDQVYKGKSFEDPRAVQACVDTKGLVLTYEGQLIEAFFHADAAGMTEIPQFVWGGSLPYYSAVDEVPHLSPHSEWKVEIDGVTVGQKLSDKGFSGSVEMIKGLKPGVSGRWFSLNVKSAKDSLELRPTEFMPIFGLKSAWFSVFRKGGNLETKGCLNPGFNVYVDNGEKVQPVKVGSCNVVGAEPDCLSGVEQGAFVLSPGEAGTLRFIFQGKGSGHGVGMSQYGANAMAESNYSYLEILEHYYPKAKIEKWW